MILLKSQVDYTGSMDELYISKGLPHLPITPEKNIVLNFAESRAYLASLGLDGEIIPTPGHSDDSVTLIIDDSYAFTGDLPYRFTLPEDDLVSQQSWDRIYKHKITRLFPAHGG